MVGKANESWVASISRNQRCRTRKPHYMTSHEQKTIEFFAPDYLRRIVAIVSEMGLCPQKELFPTNLPLNK